MREESLDVIFVFAMKSSYGMYEDEKKNVHPSRPAAIDHHQGSHATAPEVVVALLGPTFVPATSPPILGPAVT